MCLLFVYQAITHWLALTSIRPIVAMDGLSDEKKCALKVCGTFAALRHTKRDEFHGPAEEFRSVLVVSDEQSNHRSRPDQFDRVRFYAHGGHKRFGHADLFLCFWYRDKGLPHFTTKSTNDSLWFCIKYEAF